ncbi:MAG: hypothetical protein P4M11_12735 [Candidatus Pacebacteria bacterium]|nr:hypothetical protein [Candidatus Paceibacterota bacterium]
MDRVYCPVDDPEQTPIDTALKIKGYQYGKQLVRNRMWAIRVA